MAVLFCKKYESYKPCGVNLYNVKKMILKNLVYETCYFTWFWISESYFIYKKMIDSLIFCWMNYFQDWNHVDAFACPCLSSVQQASNVFPIQVEVGFKIQWCKESINSHFTVRCEFKFQLPLYLKLAQWRPNSPPPPPRDRISYFNSEGCTLISSTTLTPYIFYLKKKKNLWPQNPLYICGD